MMGEKAVVYARVSTREQADSGYSIEAQTKLLKDFRGLMTCGKCGCSFTAEARRSGATSTTTAPPGAADARTPSSARIAQDESFSC